jgi:AmmeMemoRadiSam system protein B
MIRQPAVRGQFYPSDPEDLKKIIASFGINKIKERKEAIACILPHAGYVYSGKVAAQALAGIKIGASCIIIGPNHTGYGVPYSLMKEGAWLTPLGNVPVDTALADELLKNSKYLEVDEMAHTYEHSIEVQLPIIHEMGRPDFSFVPIILASGDNLVYKDIAQAIASAVQKNKKEITLIASSDLTHYESQENANKKDKEAIQAILELDPEGLLEKIDRYQISMCGYIPTVVILAAAKILGAKKARLTAYQTSGDVTGDYSSVVGYASIVIQ